MMAATGYPTAKHLIEKRLQVNRGGKVTKTKTLDKLSGAQPTMFATFGSYRDGAAEAIALAMSWRTMVETSWMTVFGSNGHNGMAEISRDCCIALIPS